MNIMTMSLKTSSRNTPRDFECFFFFQAIPRNVDIFRIQKGQTSEKNLLNKNRKFFFLVTKNNLTKLAKIRKSHVFVMCNVHDSFQIIVYNYLSVS